MNHRGTPGRVWGGGPTLIKDKRGESIVCFFKDFYVKKCRIRRSTEFQKDIQKMIMIQV